MHPHPGRPQEHFMAISSIDYLVFRELAKAKAIPPQPDVLELGEANWYGDVEIGQLVGDIQEYANKDTRVELLKQLEILVSNLSAEGVYFDIAKAFYKTFLDYRSITAIDLHGTSKALRYDLNEPVAMDRQFHVAINTGTAEHVFNVCQFFKTVHERTCPEGLMIHAFPFVGWLDHGFYNFNPTMIADLAAANQYVLLVWVYSESQPFRFVQIKNIEQLHEMKNRGEIRENSMLHAVLRKPREERIFVAPIQGYYSGSLSASATRDWTELK
jgi:hypothetical protein